MQTGAAPRPDGSVTGGKCAGPGDAGLHGLGHGFGHTCIVVLLDEHLPIARIHADKCLGDAIARQTHLNIDGATVAQGFFVAAAIELTVRPFPVVTTPLAHGFCSSFLAI
ncbi:hypothetical protein D3C81_2000860 [compost metagenome]